jgi:phospholipase/carboxylesterase
MDWFRGWIDSEADGRRVVLVGFSGGAAFAGGLLLDDPRRWDGVALLFGTLPFDAGVPVVDGGLAGTAVLVVQGETDTVIPRDLLDATWAYVTGPSAAPASTRRSPGGHGIDAESLDALRAWIAVVTA